MRIALLALVLVATVACGGESLPAATTIGTGPIATTTVGTTEPGNGGSVGLIDPCTLLTDDELTGVFVDLFAPPTGERTSPGGLTDLCTWQDVAGGTLLRVELDTVGRIPVPPADPACSAEDCPVPGLGIESRADLRETISYVVVRLDAVTVRIQEAGLDLSGEQLIALATVVVSRLGG